MDIDLMLKVNNNDLEIARLIKRIEIYLGIFVEAISYEEWYKNKTNTFSYKIKKLLHISKEPSIDDYDTEILLFDVNFRVHMDELLVNSYYTYRRKQKTTTEYLLDELCELNYELSAKEINHKFKDEILNFYVKNNYKPGISRKELENKISNTIVRNNSRRASYSQTGSSKLSRIGDYDTDSILDIDD